MLILKCTQKAAREFGVQRSKLPQMSPDEDATLLGPWFVNAVKFGRQKALIFMNADTLYAFLAPYLKKDLTNLHRLFLDNLLRNFFAEGLPPAAIERVMDDYSDGFVLARSDDRQVIGVMNNAVLNYDVLIQREGGFPRADLLAVTRNINSIPQWKYEGESPAQTLAARLASG